MNDLPFLVLRGNTPEEKILSIAEYLSQFREILEDSLMDISIDNLSPELAKKLNELGIDINNAKTENENTLAKVNTNTLTISDVCNSAQFKYAVKEQLSGTFTVNYNTGHLEYAL